MSVFPQIDFYRFNIMPIKILANIFEKKKKVDSKTYGSKKKKSRIAKTILKTKLENFYYLILRLTICYSY